METNYAVITFTSNSKRQIAEAMDFLRSKNMPNIAEWLNNNYTTLYGLRGVDWKPFNGSSSFQQIVDELGLDGSYNITNKIDRVMSGISEVSDNQIADVLEGTEDVNFIIDIFTICSSRYLVLLKYIASAFGREKKDCKSSVCIVCPYGFDSLHSEAISCFMSLVKDYLRDVHICFTKGISHRLVTHELGGLKNYLYELRLEKIPPGNALKIPFQQGKIPQNFFR